MKYLYNIISIKNKTKNIEEIKMLIKKCKHLIEVINKQSRVLFSHQMKNCLNLMQLQQPHSQHRATYSFTMALGVMSMALLLLPFYGVDAVGYSYTRFVGPVTGPERKIFVNDGKTQMRGSGAPRYDYIGKPEYEFAYGVEDADAHILHNRNEMRDGDAVKGVYSLIDPDGTLRVVKYTADETNGFQAEVIRNGVSSLNGQLHHDYIHTPPSKTIYNSHYNPNYKYHQYPPSQMHLKDDGYVNYPSSNTYKPNVVKLQQIKHETPPQLPIIYNYNKNYDDEYEEHHEANNENNSYDHEDQQPHYEVHEKNEDENQENQDQPPQYKVHEKPDEDTQEGDHGMKVNNDVQVASEKKKKPHRDEDDDDEDYDDADDSEEVDDYDEAVHAAHNSEESFEYY